MSLGGWACFITHCDQAVYNGLDGIAVLGFDMLKEVIASTDLVDLFAGVSGSRSAPHAIESGLLKRAPGALETRYAQTVQGAFLRCA